MNAALSVFLVLGCLLLSVSARPQQPINWNDIFVSGQPQNNFFPQQFPQWQQPQQNPTTAATTTTTPAPGNAVPTTASPQYLACMAACPSTMEYNPVCGSDNENYHNSGRLNCATRCGQNVTFLRLGTCAPL